MSDLNALIADPSRLRPALLDLLRETLGPAVELAGCDVLNRRHDYVVLRAALRRPRLDLSIKLAGPEAPYASPFDRTVWLHQLVGARTSIPMPEVLAVDVTYRSRPWRYMIKTHLPGREWGDVRPHLSPGELDVASRQMGRAIAEMHAIRFPLFGEISADGDVAGSSEYLPALAERARATIPNPRLRDQFLALLDARADAFAGVDGPGLCHEDLHKHNVLFERRVGTWRIATILDFDKAWAGCPETDLARLELWNNIGSDAFWVGYRDVRPVSESYASRREILQYFWCLEVAWTTPAHLADTRRLCAALGLPILESFD